MLLQRKQTPSEDGVLRFQNLISQKSPIQLLPPRLTSDQNKVSIESNDDFEMHIDEPVKKTKRWTEQTMNVLAAMGAGFVGLFFCYVSVQWMQHAEHSVLSHVQQVQTETSIKATSGQLVSLNEPWYVLQCGVFSEMEQAESMKRSLDTKGFPSTVTTSAPFSIYSGVFQVKSDALRAAQILRSQGIDVFVKAISVQSTNVAFRTLLLKISKPLSQCWTFEAATCSKSETWTEIAQSIQNYRVNSVTPVSVNQPLNELIQIIAENCRHPELAYGRLANKQLIEIITNDMK